MSENKNWGMFVIISGPGSSGKDTVINELLTKLPKSSRLVTTTSRAPRPGEKNGINYWYITKKEFENKIKNNEFIETNNMAGNWYGIEKEKLKTTLTKNSIIFGTPDVNGKKNLERAKIPHFAIFLMPEENQEKSLLVLRNRMEKRGAMTKEAINKRLEIAKKEMLVGEKEYPIKIINRDGKLAETVLEIQHLLEKELKKR